MKRESEESDEEMAEIDRKRPHKENKSKTESENSDEGLTELQKRRKRAWLELIDPNCDVMVCSDDDESGNDNTEGDC